MPIRVVVRYHLPIFEECVRHPTTVEVTGRKAGAVDRHKEGVR